jgi:hypothetical protein
LRRLVFSNDHEGFRKLLDQAEALRVQHGLKKVVPYLSIPYVLCRHLCVFPCVPSLDS